jgi:crossover junction endodeoxyribonuclease RuvC
MSKRTKRSPPGRLVIGFDPGLAIVGYAVVREAKGKLTLLACNVIRTPSHTPLEDRLLVIYDQAMQILLTYHPYEAALETLFFGKNRTTALDVSQARGVLLLALRKQCIPLAHYSPSLVKQIVAGSGRANKALVGERVRQQLHLKAVPRPDDAADAAAVALCHIAVSQAASVRQ